MDRVYAVGDVEELIAYDHACAQPNWPTFTRLWPTRRRCAHTRIRWDGGANNCQVFITQRAAWQTRRHALARQLDTIEYALTHGVARNDLGHIRTMDGLGRLPDADTLYIFQPFCYQIHAVPGGPTASEAVVSELSLGRWPLLGDATDRCVVHPEHIAVLITACELALQSLGAGDTSTGLPARIAAVRTLLEQYRTP